jgi:hypothetical protein
VIERLVTLIECVDLAVNNIGASHIWNEAYYPKIIDLLNVLGPVLRLQTLGFCNTY